MREIRDTGLSGLEVRRDADGKPVGISGYALRFHDPNDRGTEFELTNRVTERIMPGSVRFTDDTLATFNHNSSQLLGRSSSGTARFSVDQRGMRFDIDLPDTSTGRDVAELVQRGDLRGASFAFTINGEEGESVRKEGDRYIRELRAITVHEAGPVSQPAYAATSVDMRSVEAAMGQEAESAKNAAKRAAWLRGKRLELTNPTG